VACRALFSRVLFINTFIQRKTPLPPIIEARDIVKTYPNGVTANRGVSLSVERGEIHALVGENGAGKSTLMKILYGLERPTSGKIILRGSEITIPNPQAAIKLGIGMVHQNLMLVPSFTVAENVVLNTEPTKGLVVDRVKSEQRVRELSEQYGLHVEPAAVVGTTPVGMRQRVEILKALYRGADIFILDEPTAVLTPGETRDLFRALRTLVKQGKTVIFITHKLREVLEISDAVTVMRDGQLVGNVQTENTSENELARMMVGREVFMQVNKPAIKRGSPVLQVRNLSYSLENGVKRLDDVTFEVAAGEIVGIAGVEGNGQTELVEVLTGLRPAGEGTVSISGRIITGRDPRSIREAGVAHIPEDRLTDGAATGASIVENLIVDRYYRSPFTRAGIMSMDALARNARDLISKFRVLARDEHTPMRSLSGGNMQKVIVAREFSSDPKLLIAAQPTRGVDIGAIEFIHQQIVDKRTEGLAVLLISADLQEVMKLSDRLLVMHAGHIVATFDNPASVSEEELGLYMLGAKRQSPIIPPKVGITS
jgi:general nucleoside transport system ATP-binding protein